MKATIVFGTRPEILKLVPVIRELESNNIETQLLYTNQHFSKNMGEDFFEEFNIKPKKYSFGFHEWPVKYWIKQNIKDSDVVIVQGDTRSAYLGAVAGFESKIPVAHIEAGIRSNNTLEPFPEELYRTHIDSLATYLFCPSKYALENIQDNLLAWQEAIVTGNTIIDLVKSYKLKPTKEKKVLITLHRRENWPRIKELCEGINFLIKNYINHKFVIVKHANRELAKIFEEDIVKADNVELCEPCSHKEFISKMLSSELLISDSGGIVEEASYFHIPVISVRNYTDRQEAIESGNAILCGTHKDNLLFVATSVLDNQLILSGKNPYGDGTTSRKIVKYLMEKIGNDTNKK